LYQTVVLLAINVMLFSDQNLMAPNLSAIATDLGLSADERDRYLGGYVSLGFFTVGAVSSILAGFAADSWNRIWCLFAVVLVGESACMSTYWVQTYQQFIAVRSLTGLSVGANVPILFSLLGDLYRPSYRGRIIALASVCMGLGVGLGQVLAAALGAAYSWREPFLVVAVPGLALAVLLVATTRDPTRGGKETALDDLRHPEADEWREGLTCARLARLFGSPSVAVLLVQGLPSSLPWGVVIVYFNDYFAQEMGMGVRQSTALVLSYGGGIVLGQLFAGWLTDRWTRRRRFKSLVLLASAMYSVGAAPMIGVLHAPPGVELWLVMLLCAPSGFAAGIPACILRTMLLNVAAPEVRGTAFAVDNLQHDVGRGLGPFFVSLLLGAMPGERATALSISFAFWVLSSLAVLPLLATYERDLLICEQQMRRAYLEKRANLGLVRDIDNADLDELSALDSLDLLQPEPHELELRLT
jgi:MFS family permease